MWAGIAIRTVAAPEQKQTKIRGRFHRNFNSTCGIGKHDRLGVGVREVEAVPEEQRPHERQFLELFQRDRLFQQLPFRLQGEELVNELLRVRQEVVVIIFVPVIKKL